MKLNDKVYDLLKYLGMIGLPAIAVAYQSLAQVWSLPYSEQIPSTVLIIVTFSNFLYLCKCYLPIVAAKHAEVCGALGQGTTY